MAHTARNPRNAHHALTAAALAWLSLCALAPAHAGPQGTAVVVQAGNVQVQYTQAPPPPRHEATPRPRHGMAWVPGHWEWRGHRHVWMGGHWVKARPGYHYRPVQWQERDGRWHMQPGGWDRDGDGIPNRYDKDKDGDGIGNRHDRDRDGDGVPNRHDRRPDNGHRY